VFPRVHARIVLRGTPADFAAIADGWAVGPEKAGGRLELLCPLVIHPKDDGAEVSFPSLVTRRVPCNVKAGSRTIRSDHERYVLACNDAAQRMAGGNDVVRERVAYGHAVGSVTCRVWIKYLPTHDWAAKSICTDLAARE